MVKNLITGTTGMVGSHLAEFLLKKGEEVYGTRRWRSRMDNCKSFEDKISWVNMELIDAHSVRNAIESVKPDVIYHLAAQSYVVDSKDEPAATISINTLGTLHILETVKEIKKREGYNPIIHICSSSEVYGQVEKDEVPIKENNQYRPASPYAIGKLGADMLARWYFEEYDLKTIRTRMFTHTGPRRGDVFVVSAFAKQIAKIEKGLQEPILKVGNLESVRTFADVRNTVHAYYLLTKHCKPGEVYNIGGNRTMKIGEMLEILLGFSPMKDKIKVKVDPKLLRKTDVTYQIPDTTKFKKETGWDSPIPLEKTLEDTLNYWREELL
jgi:GDP-mannose 4,6-dehydratase